MSTKDFIYKILPRAVWLASRTRENLLVLDVDEEDGFIHFSTHPQIIKTLNKHFKGQRDLVLLEVATPDLPEAVRKHLVWEKNHPEGDAYPHLYTDLPISCVANVYDVTLKHDVELDVPGLAR